MVTVDEHRLDCLRSHFFFFQVVFYKKLHKVYFTHSIPKSASGKILRRELRAKLSAAASA